MRLRPWDLEIWAKRCEKCIIDLDASGAPAPYHEEEWSKVPPLQIANNEMELGEKLAELISSIYGVRREQVALSLGAQQANFLFLFSYLTHQDMVAVEKPGYPPIQIDAELICDVKNFPRKGCQDFRPEIADLEGLLEQGAKVVALTNLHNPSAAVLRDEDQRAILETAEDFDSLVLVDEIYKEMTYSTPPRSIAQLGENGIATSGLTKMFGLRGLRIGWLVGPEDLMRNVEILRIYLNNHLPMPSLHFAIEALRRREWFRERALRIAKGNLKLLKEWLENERRISCRLPDGGLMVLLNLPRGVDDVKLAEVLVDKYKTAVGPGSFFASSGSIRATFSLEGERFERGLRNISSALDDIGL